MKPLYTFRDGYKISWHIPPETPAVYVGPGGQVVAAKSFDLEPPFMSMKLKPPPDGWVTIPMCGSSQSEGVPSIPPTRR